MRSIAFQKPLNIRKACLLAPFSKRYRRIASARTLPPELMPVIGNCIAFNEGNALFVKNHKAACSTIARLIYFHENQQDYAGNIHQVYDGLVQGLPNFPAVVEAIRRPGTFRFTFVRDPVARAVSAYKNIFLEKTNQAWSLHEAHIRQWGFNDSASDGDNFEVFLDYITESLHREPYLTDPHFRRQVDNTGVHHLQFDVIGYVESMDADLSALSGILPEVQRGARSSSGERKANRTTVVFTPDDAQVARLKAIYREDYEVFAYQ